MIITVQQVKPEQKYQSAQSESEPADSNYHTEMLGVGLIVRERRDVSFDQLMSDERTKDAILRNLQVIGEASKNLPP